MAKYTRSTLTGDNAPVNAELEKIQSAINDQFDRNPTGGVANQLDGDLDANSKRIYNLPAPSNPNDAARLKDVQEAASGSGTVLPDQTGQEGKYLKTDATTAFWGEVSKSSIGLGSVDNTTDLLKPVSTAQQTEINTRALQVDTFANLELLTSTTTGQAFICQERANASYILQASSYVALAGDATFANGRVSALQVKGSALMGNFAQTEQGFLDALSRSSVLDMQNITLTFTTTATTIATITNKKIINGQLDITVSSTSFRALFFLDGGKFDSVIFNINVPAGGQVALFRPTGDNSGFNNCVIDGKVTDNGTTASHLFYVIQVSASVDVDNFHSNNNIVSNFSFFHLKTNSTTTTQKGWRANDNTLSGVYVEGVGINSPNGIVENFEADRNTFLSHPGHALGTYALYIAVASGNDVQVIGNKFYGTVDQCIHLEENVNGFVISNNISRSDCKGGVIGFLENDIGGATTQPSNGVVSGNVFKKTGVQKEAGSYGIWIIDNLTSPSDAKNIIVTDNICEGFEHGISTDAQEGDYSSIYGNKSIGCKYGYTVNRAVKQIGENTAQDCEVGVFNGGNYATQFELKAINCTAISSGKFTLINLEVIYPVTAAVVGGSVFLPIVSEASNTRVYGDVMITAMKDGSSNNTSNKLISCGFDGSTLSKTDRYAVNLGSVQADIESNSSNVAVKVFSSNAGDLETTIKINGFITVH